MEDHKWRMLEETVGSQDSEGKSLISIMYVYSEENNIFSGIRSTENTTMEEC